MSSAHRPAIVTLCSRKCFGKWRNKDSLVGDPHHLTRHLRVARKKEEFVNLTLMVLLGLTNVVEMSALILTVANHSNLVKLGFKYEKLDLLLFRNECHMSNNNMISDHKS